MSILKKVGSNLFLFLLIVPCLAFSETAISIGTVADNALTPAKVVGEMISAGCLILGVGLVAGSFIRYMEYKRNPVQTRLSTPILFFIFGLTLVLLPYIGTFSSATTALDNDQKVVESPSEAPLPVNKSRNEQIYNQKEIEKQFNIAPDTTQNRAQDTRQDTTQDRPQNTVKRFNS
jgi:hypothetical protein